MWNGQHTCCHCFQPPLPRLCCFPQPLSPRPPSLPPAPTHPHPQPHPPEPMSPHQARSQERATAGSALNMDTGTARSLVGWPSGQRAMMYWQDRPLSLMRSSPGAGGCGCAGVGEGEVR